LHPSSMLKKRAAQILVTEAHSEDYEIAAEAE
jgi:hypothetical protein